MRILVTGHNGYIGTVLTPMLLEAGYEVAGLDSNLFERVHLWRQRAADSRPVAEGCARCRTHPIWKDLTPFCTWPACPMIRWAI